MAAVLTPDSGGPAGAREVRIFPDLEHLSRAAAAGIADLVRAAVGATGRCTVALSGGGTPAHTYHLLATHRGAIPWGSVHLFWGDERYVPADSPDSNYRMAREALLSRVPVPLGQIHRVPTGPGDPREAAAAYEATLHEHLDPLRPRFDLVLLGLGDDGHTASLFPGSTALAEGDRWVVAVAPPEAPSVRVTLTLPVLNAAAHVHFLVAGASKAAALRRALAPGVRVEECPAGGVRPADGSVVWWVDADAARLEAPVRDR